jgi:hypothetical protein
VKVVDDRPAAIIIQERLERLAHGAVHVAGQLAGNGVEIVDADVTEEEGEE